MPQEPKSAPSFARSGGGGGGFRPYIHPHIIYKRQSTLYCTLFVYVPPHRPRPSSSSLLSHRSQVSLGSSFLLDADARSTLSPLSSLPLGTRGPAGASRVGGHVGRRSRQSRSQNIHVHHFCDGVTTLINHISITTMSTLMKVGAINWAPTYWERDWTGRSAVRRPPGVARRRSLGGASTLHSPSTPHLCVTSKLSCDWAAGGPGVCTSPKMMREC